MLLVCTLCAKLKYLLLQECHRSGSIWESADIAQAHKNLETCLLPIRLRYDRMCVFHCVFSQCE